MKIHYKLISILWLYVAASVANSQAQDHGEHAHDHEHGHESEKMAGPNGGRVVSIVDPALEFFVAEDGKAIVTFLDDAGAAIPPAGQEVTLVGGDRSDPTTFRFARVGDSLVSDQALPVDKAIPLVLQVRSAPGAKVVRERFNLNLAKCPTCEFAEYACACHDD